MPDHIKARPFCLLISLLCCTVSPPAPSSGQVSGRVIDLNDRGPIVRAVVELQGSGLSEQTDSAGRFTIPAQLPPGCHRLYVRFLGIWMDRGEFPRITDAPHRSWRRTTSSGALARVAAPSGNTCDAGPISKDEAPLGVDTLRSR